MSRGVLDAEANPRVLASMRVALGVLAVGRMFQLERLDASWYEYVAWLLLATALVLGWHGRLAAALLAAWVPTFMAQGQWTASGYLFFLAMVFVALSDCERHYAVRARGTGRVAGWPAFLMACQVSIVYGFAAIAKINRDFLSGDVLEHYFTRAVLPVPDVGPLLIPLAVSVVAIELFLAAALWSRRARPIAFSLALPLHLGMFAVATHSFDVRGVILFAGVMFILMTAFLDVPERGRLVVWDDSCSFCRRWVAWFGRLDAFGAFRFVGASSADAYAGTGVTLAAATEAMQLVEPDGRVLSGYDAVRGIIAVLPGGFLLAPWMAFPGVPRMGRALYRRVAERRTCAYAPAR